MRVLYVDVTSLYPYVNSAFPYPLGHLEIIHRDFEDVRNYFGLIRAVVLPPRGLYFPLLPYKTTACNYCLLSAVPAPKSISRDPAQRAPACFDGGVGDGRI